MCYRFRVISEIRSNNEFSSRETKAPGIRMNTKMLNAFLLFSRKRNSQIGFITHLLILSMEAFTDTLPMLCMGFKKCFSSIHSFNINKGKQAFTY